MPRAEENFLIGCLVDLIALEKDVEMMKINLTLKTDFNLMDAFSLLDKDCKSEVTPTELKRQLAILNLDLKEDDLALVY